MKKTLIILLVLAIITTSAFSKKHRKRNIDFSAITSADMLTQWIRNRGTYIYQLLNINKDNKTASAL